MLGIGMWEMIVIGGIALVVIGPEKFPDFAKIVLRTVRDLRGYMDEVKRDVSKEINPLKREIDKLSRIDPEKYLESLTAGDSDEDEKKPDKTSGEDATDPYDGFEDEELYGEYPDYVHEKESGEPGEADSTESAEGDAELPGAEDTKDIH